MNFIERLNFSDTETADSVLIKKWHDVNHYETLCLYCADNDIDISEVSESEFQSAAFLMQDHGQYDGSTDHYYFSIDR